MTAYIQALPTPPRLNNFGVCDDIRLEQLGKFTFIGYYGRSIRVATLPTVFPKLSFFASFSYFSEPEVVSVRLTSPSGVSLLAADNVRLMIAPEFPGTPLEFRENILVFHIVPMPLNEPGEYRVLVEFAETRALASFFVGSIEPLR